MNIHYLERDHEGLAVSACRQVEDHARRGDLTIEQMSQHITDLAHIMMLRLEKNEALKQTFRNAREAIK
jgi:hypothetical protein